MGILERVKTAMRTWLEIEPGTDAGAIKIDSALSFDAQVLRNRIWYRGDPSEIDQFLDRKSVVFGKCLDVGCGRII